MSDRVSRVLENFEALNRIPRCSKNEKMISNWLVDWAKDHGFEAKQDEVFNVLIKVPATMGFENSPTLILQGHMDMVCVRGDSSNHDFSNDPIKIIQDGEWLKADNTTLGADNGIAIAMAMAFAEDTELQHPPLELLFTVDEETGLTGASKLTTDFLDGRVLINIDSEDEGYFTIGCAGGANVKIKKSFTKSDADGMKFIKVNISGLKGGHSGIEINEPRVNAIKVLSEILDQLSDFNIRIYSISGGIAHNAIPSNAEVVFAINAGDLPNVLNKVLQDENQLMNKYSKIEENINIFSGEVFISDEAATAYNAEESREIINLLQNLPHGVMKMSEIVEGAVETSCNLAQISTTEDKIVLTMSLRSNVDASIDGLRNKIETIAAENNASILTSGQYPSWQPNTESELVSKCKSIYEQTFNKSPKIEVIHAGLECGIIGSKYEGMDMISLGPTIKHPHTPVEKLHIPSLERVWTLLERVVESYKD